MARVENWMIVQGVRSVDGDVIDSSVDCDAIDSSVDCDASDSGSASYWKNVTNGVTDEDGWHG